MYLWWMGVAEPLIQATLLAEALDNGPVAVFVVGDDFRHIAVNQYACTLLGYTREELLALSARELAPELQLDEQLVSALSARRLGGRTVCGGRTDRVEIEFRATRPGRRNAVLRLGRLARRGLAGRA